MIRKNIDSKTEYEPQTREDLEKVALNQGWEVFFADSNELFVDLDDGAQINSKVFSLMMAHGYITNTPLKTTSPGGGVHAYFKLNRLQSLHERTILEAALGSDPTRAFMCLAQNKDFSALFETLEEAEKVRKWRAQFIFEEEELAF